jgi:hypothetical protein
MLKKTQPIISNSTQQAAVLPNPLFLLACLFYTGNAYNYKKWKKWNRNIFVNTRPFSLIFWGINHLPLRYLSLHFIFQPIKINISVLTFTFFHELPLPSTITIRSIVILRAGSITLWHCYTSWRYINSLS